MILNGTDVMSTYKLNIGQVVLYFSGVDYPLQFEAKHFYFKFCHVTFSLVHLQSNNLNKFE